MVAVRDVALVGDAGNHAEATLQRLRELVRGRLERRAVEREVDVGLRLPLGALVVHMLHDLHGERRALRLGVAVAGHVLHALVEPRVAERNGGIPAVEQFVDRLALLKARKRTVLPQNRRGIGKRALQAIMAAHESLTAQLETLVENLPELRLVAMGRKRHIRQADGDNALVEAPIVFRLARFVVARVRHVVVAVAGTVGREEAAAPHARVAIAVALGLALGQLHLAHLLLGDIVGHHALRRALRRHLREVEIRRVLAHVVFLKHVDELGKRRRDPHSSLVFHALVALAQRFLDDHGKVVLLGLGARLVQVHEHGDEWGLTVGSHQRDDLVLDGLHAAADLVAQAAFHHFGDAVGVGLEPELVDLLEHLAANLLAGNVDEGR